MELENDYVCFVQKTSAIDKAASNKCVNEFWGDHPFKLLPCRWATGMTTP